MQAAQYLPFQSIREAYTLTVGWGMQVVVSGGITPKPPTTRPFLTYGLIIEAVTLIPETLARVQNSDALGL